MASIFDQARKTLKDLQSKATSAAKNTAQNFNFNPTSNNGNNFWKTPIAQGLGQAQRFVQAPPRVNITQYANNIKPPVPKLAAQVGLGIGEDFINLPQRLLSGGARLGTEIRTGGIRNPARALGAGAAVASPLIDVATLGGGTLIKGVGKGAVKQVAKSSLKSAVLKGGLQGAGIGAGYGFLSGLAEGQEASGLVAGQRALQGAAVGGVFGAGAAGVGNIAGQVLQAIKKTTPGISEKEAQKRAAIYLRDTAGRFSGLKKNEVFEKAGGGLSKPGSIKVNNWQSKIDQELGVDPNYRIPAGLQIRDISKEQLKSAPEQVMEGFDPTEYINELKNKQSAAGTVSTGLKGKISSFNSKIKSSLIDSTSPIEDALSLAEKKGKFQVRPTQDIRLQIDKVLRAKTIASQFAEDNGLVDVIKKAPDLDALDQYMIAKQAGKVAELGKTTGRNLEKDQQLINALAPEYEQYAKQVNQYSQKLLDYSVESGLIDPSLATALKQKYPEYVPLQRVFNELEKTNYSGSTKAIASLSKQSVVQKLEGSEREIASPIESLLLKTQTAFEQGEKNRAGKMLAGYKDLPGFQNLIRELKGDEKATHTFSYLDNGVKRTFETSPEIAAAAKNLNQEQMNIVLKTLAVPTRTLQLGATGLNVPFVVTNLAKDQITAFVNSNKAAKTSLLNPNNFLKAMFSAVKHDDLYDEVIRNAAGGTSFDISRKAPNLSVARIRAGRNIGSKIKYTVTTKDGAAGILRSLEDIVGRTEELTRIQQYRGTKNALLSEGRTAQDAALLGAKAARENTTNFARKGDIGKVINYIIPFFNAGIQGARTLTRNVQQRPAQTGAKAAVAIFMPVAATTMWNLTDPARKAIYDDIDEFEKQNNLILIPDDAKLDEKGRYNVIKIPLPPGLSNLGTIVRRGIETAHGADPLKLQEVATNVIAAGTSIDLSSPTKTISSFIPQAVKGTVETQTNTNLFTGKPIVPYSLQDLPPNEQARPYTSGTARKIAKVPLLNSVIGDSPLKVENFIRTTAGGLGSQLLNASDTALAAVGNIPKEQISGENALQNLQRRFSQASGGNQQEQEFKKITEYKQEAALGQNEARVKAESVVKQLQNATTPDERRQILTSNISTEKELDQVISLMEDASAGTTSSERAVRALPVEQRASYISEKISNVSKEEKKKILIDYYKKGILTEAVLDQMLGL